MPDILGGMNITATCSYYGEPLSFEVDGPVNVNIDRDNTLNLSVEWDHSCSAPPDLIRSALED